MSYQLRLTGRQQEVLEMLAAGKSNAEIAELLGCSTKTVRNHCNEIYAKLGVGDRNAAVEAARRHGLLPKTPKASRKR